MKHLILVSISSILFIGCGMNHRVSGGVDSDSKVTIDITSSLCNDPNFTPDQKLQCIALITSIKAKVEADINVDEDINTLAEILDNAETGTGVQP